MPRSVNRPPFYSAMHESWAIPLTKGVIALVDEDVAADLGSIAWQARSSRGKCWYAVHGYGALSRREGPKCLYMHVVIVGPTAGAEVDHRLHRPFAERVVDNRRANLRQSTRSENASNFVAARQTLSRYRGLNFHRNSGLWGARISKDMREIFLGWFRCEEDAARAYDEAAIRVHGEFAITNASLGLL